MKKLILLITVLLLLSWGIAFAHVFFPWGQEVHIAAVSTILGVNKVTIDGNAYTVEGNFVLFP